MLYKRTVRDHYFIPEGIPDSVSNIAFVGSEPEVKFKQLLNHSTPGYPELLGKRELTTEVFATRSRFKPFTIKNGYASYTAPGTSMLRTVDGELFINIPGIVLPLSIAGECKAKLASNIYQAQAGWAGGVFVGELRETIRLLRNPLLGLQSAFSSLGPDFHRLKSKHGRYSRRFMSEWSKLYLSFTYGVQPLYADANGFVNRYNEIQDKVAAKLVTAKVSKQETFKHDAVTRTAFDSFFEFHHRKLTHYKSVANGNALILCVPEGGKHSLNNYGLRPGDFVPTLYELIPFSFVLDYFSNANEVLNSQFVERSSVIYSWITERRKAGTTHSVERAKIIAPALGELFVENATRQESRTQRWREENLGATFSTSLPNLKQTLNLGALIHVISQIK